MLSLSRFNSVVFSNLQANTYTVITGSEDFLAGGLWNTSGLIGVDSNASTTIVSTAQTIRNESSSGNKYINMTTGECFYAFDSQYVSGIGNVLLVQDATIWHNPEEWGTLWNHTSSYIWGLNSTLTAHETNYTFADRGNRLDMLPFKSDPGLYPSNGWRCPSRNVSSCNVNAKVEISDVSVSAPYGSPVKYCLVEHVPKRCRVQFSFSIALAVIVCNAVKAVCMAITLFKHRKPSLVTLGDAIAAFLDNPDATTKGRCLYNKQDFQKEWIWDPHDAEQDNAPDVPALEYYPKRIYWARASGRLRRFCTYALYTAALIFSGICIKRSTAGLSTHQIWKSGIGTLNGNNLLSMGTSLIGGVTLANIPQALLSYLYLTFNALFTCMFIADMLIC